MLLSSMCVYIYIHWGLNPDHLKHWTPATLPLGSPFELYHDVTATPSQSIQMFQWCIFRCGFTVKMSSPVGLCVVMVTTCPPPPK